MARHSKSEAARQLGIYRTTLYRLIEQLRHEIQRTRVLLLRTPERLDYSMREHDQIMDAFLKKNPALAESTMVRHMQNQMETLRKLTDTGEQR